MDYACIKHEQWSRKPTNYTIVNLFNTYLFKFERRKNWSFEQVKLRSFNCKWLLIGGSLKLRVL